MLNLVAWLFSPQKSHLLMLSRCWIGRKIAFSEDCTYVYTIKHPEVYRLTYYDWRLIQNEVYWIPKFIFLLEFQILESEFRFLNFSSAEFKRNSNRNLWNQKRNWNSASSGGPRNLTKNRNSQPRQQQEGGRWAQTTINLGSGGRASALAGRQRRNACTVVLLGQEGAADMLWCWWGGRRQGVGCGEGWWGQQVCCCVTGTAALLGLEGSGGCGPRGAPLLGRGDGNDYKDKDGGQCHKRGGADGNDKQQEQSFDDARQWRWWQWWRWGCHNESIILSAPPAESMILSRVLRVSYSWRNPPVATVCTNYIFAERKECTNGIVLQECHENYLRWAGRTLCTPCSLVSLLYAWCAHQNHFFQTCNSFH